MNFEDFNLSLRPRKNWEAIDLGITLTRLNWKAVYSFWCLWTTLLLVTLFVLFNNNLTIAGLLFWYIAPWGERVLLWSLSRAVFAQKTTLKENLREAPKLLTKGFFPFLFYLRFMPSRSYSSAVWLLEGQKGQDAAKRCATLNSNDFNGPVGFGLVWAHLELVFYAGLLVVFMQIIPESFHLHWLENFIENQEIPSLLEIANYWIYGITLMILRPFYCAAGFTLYLHKRMQMEGWDIELQFRRLARRSQKTASLIILCLSIFSLNHNLDAKESFSPKEAIQEVMLDPKMSREKDEKRYFRFNFKLEEKKDEQSELNLAILSEIAKVAVILILALFLFFLIRFLIKNANNNPVKVLRKKDPQNAEPITSVGELNLKKESLPTDVTQAVKELLNENNKRAAIALLYRCALARVVHVYNGQLHSSFTETECLKASRILPQQEFSYFEEITNLWMATAYAHQVPERDALLLLANKWSKMELSHDKK